MSCELYSCGAAVNRNRRLLVKSYCVAVKSHGVAVKSCGVAVKSCGAAVNVERGTKTLTLTITF